MNNKERMAAQLADLRIQDINKQMDAITKLARAYANATPEQRANVDASEIQAQIDRYENLKAERANLYAEQEARVQAELEAQRRTQEEAAAAATQGQGRRRVNPNYTPAPTPVPSGEAFPVATNTDWTVRWSDGTNRNSDGSIHDYSKDQSFVPWMTINPRYANNWLPAYDERYDVNSPNYVYNKGWYNIWWQYVVNPEYQWTYGRYDAWGRLISDEVLNERQAYQDTLNMPWEKITWLNNEDLLMAAAPYANEIAWAVRWLWNIPYVRFNNVGNTLKSLPGGTNNYLTQWNNYLTQWNNFLTNQSVWLQRAYQWTPRVNSWWALERLRNL